MDIKLDTIDIIISVIGVYRSEFLLEYFFLLNFQVYVTLKNYVKKGGKKLKKYERDYKRF